MCQQRVTTNENEVSLKIDMVSQLNQYLSSPVCATCYVIIPPIFGWKVLTNTNTCAIIRAEIGVFRWRKEKIIWRSI